MAWAFWVIAFSRLATDMALHRLKPTKPKKGKRGKPRSKNVAVPGASRRFRMSPDTLAPVLVSLCLGSAWEGGTCNAIIWSSSVVLPPILFVFKKPHPWNIPETMASCQPYTISSGWFVWRMVDCHSRCWAFWRSFSGAWHNLLLSLTCSKLVSSMGFGLWVKTFTTIFHDIS